MGKRASPQLDRFLSALHRRLVVVRALETMALGAAGGAAVGAALIPLLYWRDVPALPPTVGALMLGASMGLIWGITHAPTKLQAAAEADRQLDLADLLGTALTVGERRRESDRDEAAHPWLQTVGSLADAACRAHTPSQVILHRLHARAWGGIAIAAALVVSVATLTTPEPSARAASTAAPGRAALQGMKEESGMPEGARQPTALARPQGTGPEREGKGTTSAAADPSQDAGNPGDGGAESSRTSTAITNTGRGGGSARAANPPPGSLLPPPFSRQSPASAAGDASAGTGSAVTRPAGNGNAPGTTGGESPPAPASPPWHSPTWSDDARRAQEAIDSGRVPGNRRDLVRDYFDRR
jgi:hypothetical protein